MCENDIFNYWSCCPSINLSNYVTKDELSGISGCDLTEIEETIDDMQDDIEALQGIISDLTDRLSVLENLMHYKADISALTSINDAISGLTERVDALESGSTPTQKGYLTFKALENGTFTFTNDLEYSLDSGVTWATLSKNTVTPTVNANDEIMFKGNLLADTNGIGTFSSSGRFEVKGNIMSLVDNITVPMTYQFYGLFKNMTGLTSAEYLELPDFVNTCFYQSAFYGCTNLVTPPELPATTLANACYTQMFSNCSSLTSAPTLPSVTLATNCYRDMFSNCSSLSTAPTLPASTLLQSSYEGMFRNCTNLNSITCLATDISAPYSTEGWVRNVAATGTFTKSASMNNWLIDSVNGIPLGWTVIDDEEPTPTGNKLYATVLNGDPVALECDGDDYLVKEQVHGNDLTYMRYVNVTIGDCITELGNFAFQSCLNMEQIVLPSTIEVIHNHALRNSVYGETVKHLDIYIYAVTPPTLDNDAESGLYVFPDDCTIHVPAESVSAYKTAWSYYAEKIVGII